MGLGFNNNSYKFIFGAQSVRAFFYFFLLLFTYNEVIYADNIASQLFEQTEVDTSARVRWEGVEIGGVKSSEYGRALTLKGRLALNTKFSDELKSGIEIDGVASYLDNHHSDGIVFNGEPVVADPEGLELNQFYLRYLSNGFLIKLGRQSLRYDNERFIGNVGFRQNDQTYDALRLGLSTFTNSRLEYAYVGNVNRIFGDEAGSTLDSIDLRFSDLNGQRPASQLGNHKIDGHFINFNLKEWEYIESTIYAYLTHNHKVADFSNRTVGWRNSLRYKPEEIKYKATIEFAQQKRQQISPSNWINYHLLESAFEVGSLEIGLRQETLGSRNETAFITPLATLHKFQGWVDQFVYTPSVGLVDQNIRIKWQQRPWVLDIRYHLFTADSSSSDIGKELDVDLIFKKSRTHEIKLRYGDFRTDNSDVIRSDWRKLFLMYEYNL